MYTHRKIRVCWRKLRLAARIFQILATTLKFSGGKFSPACHKRLVNSCRKPKKTWGKSEKNVFYIEKICFFRLAPSFIHTCGKNLLNACDKQKNSCPKKVSELPQEFEKFLPQAIITFFSILEFFYECRKQLELSLMLEYLQVLTSEDVT